MVKYLRQFILIFYSALTISTILLLIKNTGRSFDIFALIFQTLILLVCAIGFVGTLLQYKFSIRYNHISILIFSFLYGLALLNAIFFNELHLITIREVILYILLIMVDYIMAKDLINRNKMSRDRKS